MLSILIPVYNFDIRPLVETIHYQCIDVGIEFEIIVLDDKSQDDYKTINQVIIDYPNVSYSELPENIGRAKIRNKLANKAKYDHLLFIDCDSQINRDTFIKDYLPYCKKEIIVYGGRDYTSLKPEMQEYFLHWIYGTKREAMTLKNRKINPNQSFMTNNFLVSKSILEQIKFNELLRGYGHEDTLFGYELKKSDIAILHIDNPVLHVGLENNKEFLHKTRNGIRNLKRILRQNGAEKNMIGDISLLNYYKKAEKLHVKGIIKFLFSITNKYLERNLCGNKPNLFYFDLYKLGYLCSLP